MSQYTGKEVDVGLSVKMRENRQHFQHLDKLSDFRPFGLKHLGPLMAAKTQNEDGLDQKEIYFNN